MKRKIISMYSHTTLVASVIMAQFLALVDLVFLPACIWVVAVIVAMAGMFYVINTENENAPEERQLSQGQRKLYNFNLSKGWGKVNGRTENL